MENRLEITNLDVSIQSPPAYTGSAETDVILEEGPVLAGYDGWTWCDDPIVEYFCDQAYIRIRGGDKFKRPIICHEAGHSVGLTHGNDGTPWRDPDSQEPGLGCLRNPVPNVDWGPYATGNINAMYP